MPDTLFEDEFIRQGILLGNEFYQPVRSFGGGGMENMQVGEILDAISDATGFKQARLARFLGVSQGTVSKWRNGKQSPVKDQWDVVLDRIDRDPRLAHLRIEVSAGANVPVMGRIGAGAVIEPDFDQAAPEGLYEVTLPFPVADDVIAFEVDGESMMQKYDPGDVIVVRRDQAKDTIAYIGQIVAVKTEDGRRFLKRLMPGTVDGLFRLESFNAAPMHNIAISWVGEIYTIVPAIQVFKAEPARSKARRRRRGTKHA